MELEGARNSSLILTFYREKMRPKRGYLTQAQAGGKSEFSYFPTSCHSKPLGINSLLMHIQSAYLLNGFPLQFAPIVLAFFHLYNIYLLHATMYQMLF